jgi:hypothetical protein
MHTKSGVRSARHPNQESARLRPTEGSSRSTPGPSGGPAWEKTTSPRSRRQGGFGDLGRTLDSSSISASATEEGWRPLPGRPGPEHMLRLVVPVSARGTWRFRDNADGFVEADRFRIHAHALSDLADPRIALPTRGIARRRNRPRSPGPGTKCQSQRGSSHPSA